MVHIGDGTGQVAFVDFAIRAANPDTSTGFYGNIAAGDLDVFAFAIHSPAANSRNFFTAAGLCMYRAAIDGDVFAVALEAAANACCFAAAISRYITVIDRNIAAAEHTRTVAHIAAADACTPFTAVGGDGAAFDHNIAAAFLGTTANACAALTAVGFQRTGAADGQGPVVVGLFHTGVAPAALQGIRAADDQLHITADRDCRTGSIDIDIMQRHFCCRGAAFDGQGVGRPAAVRCDIQITTLLGFIIALLGILFAIIPNIDCDAAVLEIHLILRFCHHIVLFVQHAHRAFGGGALLEQGIGACGQSRGGKAEHHARCQRSGSCPPGQNISFHRGSSFAKIITGGGMHYGTLIISHFTGFWKQTCVNRPKSSVKSMICAGSVAVVRPAGTAKPPGRPSSAGGLFAVLLLGECLIPHFDHLELRGPAFGLKAVALGTHGALLGAPLCGLGHIRVGHIRKGGCAHAQHHAQRHDGRKQPLGQGRLLHMEFLLFAYGGVCVHLENTIFHLLFQ